MNKIKRVYRNYSEWEEVKHNMWGKVSDREKARTAAIDFTSNHKEYGFFMNRVVLEWVVSCENALTDNMINRKAWIGHAACALALSCPEDIVRQAWGELTTNEQFLANTEAERAIRLWEFNYKKNNGICCDVGEPMLF